MLHPAFSVVVVVVMAAEPLFMHVAPIVAHGCGCRCTCQCNGALVPEGSVFIIDDCCAVVMVYMHTPHLTHVACAAANARRSLQHMQC